METNRSNRIKTFQVEILETNSRVETIDAMTREEALEKVRASYEKGEITLNETNSYVDVKISVV